MVSLLPTQLLFISSIGIQAENFYSLAVQWNKYNNSNFSQFGQWLSVYLWPKWLWILVLLQSLKQ